MASLITLSTSNEARLKFTSRVLLRLNMAMVDFGGALIESFLT